MSSHYDSDRVNHGGVSLCDCDPALLPLLLRWQGKHLTLEARNLGGDIRLEIWGRASWRKWNLSKRVKGRQLWLIKYIARLLAALEDAKGASETGPS